MMAIPPDVERMCGDHLERYFANYLDQLINKRAMQALRFIAAGNERLSDKAEGWAAGIVYALANQERQAFGVPGLLNTELERFFCVSMGKIRKRAARVEQRLAD
jgi:hypothetical protein